MKLADTFLRLFASRIDIYALQQPDGSYLKVEEAVTIKLIEKHLDRQITIGLYQLDQNNNVKWLCWDLDPEKLADPTSAATKIIQECTSKPNPENPRFYPKSLLLEASRYPDPSYHIWTFFWPLPIPAKAAHWLGLKILEHANINPKHIEVFPKQTELTKHRPYGNLVKAPLSLHRVAKKQSHFLNQETLEPLPQDCILKVQGVSFKQSDIDTICNFKQRKAIQSKLELPIKHKPLPTSEEEKVVKLLSKYWKPGFRNKVEMAFLGLCLKKGIHFKSAWKIIDQITQTTADEERSQRLQLVEYHYRDRRQLGSQLLGISGLKEIIKEVTC